MVVNETQILIKDSSSDCGKKIKAGGIKFAITNIFFPVGIYIILNF